MKPWLEDYQVKQKVAGVTRYASDAHTVGGPSPLFNAISYAFNSHCPLVLTPDSVWLTLLVGLTHHIDQDAEGLRKHFVSHEGQLLLEVTVGSPPLPHVPPEVWQAGIKLFSGQLEEKLNPDRHKLIVCDFSTTTEIDKLSSQVALMGAMKHYFQYRMYLACGFSKVTVEGTPEDWDDIINRAEALSEFNLSWWIDNLVPVLRQLKKACEGDPDIEFWKRAYLRHGYGSGSQHAVSGWVNAFYPYVAGKGPDQMKENLFVEWESNDKQNGLDTDDFPFGLVKAPVELVDHGEPHPFEFYGGLVGVSMTEDFTVRPESGIAIQQLDVEKPEEKKPGLDIETIILKN
jgi:hypothetical protein